MSQLRVLTLTTLYPNAANPSHGIFVENRLRHFIDRHNVDLKVIAPVPYFPFKSGLFGHYASYARVPRQETRHGITIYHPRYLVLPKIGMTFSAHSLSFCFKREIARIAGFGWSFDLIDAHYYYPDGVAAAKISETLHKPLVITARGTDINLIPAYPKQHEMILGASAVADASITVCAALKDEMIRLGAPEEKISVLRNGVDLEQFHPMDREKIRQDMNLEGTVLLSIGHLIDRKGHDLVIRALAEMDDATLLIVGAGHKEKSLKELALRTGVADRVRFLGLIPHNELDKIYNAADILILASSREGWPNVLLEAMACGTPCVAAPIWGNKEVITTQVAGLLTRDRSPQAIASAVQSLLDNLPSRAETRAYAQNFSWDTTSDRLNDLFTKIKMKNKAAINSEMADGNWRFDTPFQTPTNCPKILVTVDTEEIFNWSNDEFSSHTIASPSDIARFQAICEKHNVKPLYFITWPLIQDQQTASYFKDLHDTGKADLGIHLHQWVTPPVDKINTPYTSYQCNLDSTLHRTKLKNLIDLFEDTFNFKPIAHRAGRYGVSPSVLHQLAELGVYCDFSPSAGFDHSADGGPDFSGVTNTPWVRSTSNGRKPLLCIPVTGGRSFVHTRVLLPQPRNQTGQFFPISSLLKKITAPLRLTPEAFDTKDLQALSRSVIKDGNKLLVYSLHSTSLTLGATPYSLTRQDIANILTTTDQYLKWFTEGIGTTGTLGEIIAAHTIQTGHPAE